VELGHLFYINTIMVAPLRPQLRSLLTTPAKRHKHISKQSATKVSKAKWANAKCVTEAPDGPNGKRPLNPDQPLRLKALFTDLPAYEKWFDRTPGILEQARKGLLPNKTQKMSKNRRILQREDESTFEGVVDLNSKYFEQFGDAIVPLERRVFDRAGGDVIEFERFNAPLSLFLKHMEENTDKNMQLYLAQHALSDLPQALQDDLPMPEMLKNMGRGDLYGSSLWMGKAPTYTPLHRDPNPNLFVQLSGKKKFRLMSPQMGQQLYEDVMERLGKTAGQTANIRGDEMMKGKEFAYMEQAVWSDDWDHPGTNLGYEMTVKKGGGLYIPLGWWHAVRAIGKGPNVSVTHYISSQNTSRTNALFPGKLVVSLNAPVLNTSRALLISSGTTFPCFMPTVPFPLSQSPRSHRSTFLSTSFQV
jgi:hypothetical protein